MPTPHSPAPDVDDAATVATATASFCASAAAENLVLLLLPPLPPLAERPATAAPPVEEEVPPSGITHPVLAASVQRGELRLIIVLQHWLLPPGAL